MNVGGWALWLLICFFLVTPKWFGQHLAEIVKAYRQAMKDDE